MTQEEILRHVDHTNLSVTATEAEILQTVDEACRYQTAAVCIPPRFVAAAASRARGRVAICTVIGFPNGYMSAEVKCFEARDAIKAGADEIDTVIPIGLAKAGEHDAILRELVMLRKATEGKILKVIIEVSALTDAEKIALCHVVAESGADYIKTSTGFHTGGATAGDVALLRKHSPETLLVKAAGGIASFADAEQFLLLGADRLGTSRLVKLLVKASAESGAY